MAAAAVFSTGGAWGRGTEATASGAASSRLAGTAAATGATGSDSTLEVVAESVARPIAKKHAKTAHATASTTTGSGISMRRRGASSRIQGFSTRTVFMASSDPPLRQSSLPSSCQTDPASCKGSLRSQDVAFHYLPPCLIGSGPSCRAASSHPHKQSSARRLPGLGRFGYGRQRRPSMLRRAIANARLCVTKATFGWPYRTPTDPTGAGETATAPRRSAAGCPERPGLGAADRRGKGWAQSSWTTRMTPLTSPSEPRTEQVTGTSHLLDSRWAISEGSSAALVRNVDVFAPLARNMEIPGMHPQGREARRTPLSVRGLVVLVALVVLCLGASAGWNTAGAATAPTATFGKTSVGTAEGQRHLRELQGRQQRDAVGRRLGHQAQRVRDSRHQLA